MKESTLPTYYAIITADVRYDKNLKANEKLLFAEITALTNKNGYCHATNRYFSKLYDVTTKTVSRWITHIAALGYINVELLRDGNKRVIERRLYLTNTYRQKSPYPIDKKVPTPMDRNVQDNNININNIKKNRPSWQNYEQREYSEDFWNQFYANL